MSSSEYTNLCHYKKSNANTMPCSDRPGLKIMEITFPFIKCRHSIHLYASKYAAIWYILAAHVPCWGLGFYCKALFAPEQPCCLNTTSATLIFSGVGSSTFSYCGPTGRGPTLGGQFWRVWGDLGNSQFLNPVE